MNSIASNSKKIYCGIDFHKNTSTLCVLYEDGPEVQPITTIDTSRLVQYLGNKTDWIVGIEASGGVNHVVSKLKALGMNVTIINPNKFRGIGIGGKKTDDRDARALANALRLGFVPHVHHRSIRSREIKSLLTSREHIVQARVDGMNHIRGTLREYGLTMACGAEIFYKEAGGQIGKLECGPIQVSLMMIFENIGNYLEQEKAIEQSVKDLTQNDERVKRLQTIPGVGLMTSTMMVAVIDDVSRFRNAKDWAAYLGLVPSIHASANKKMMGSITRSGCEMLRRYLIHGARSWMRYSPKEDRNRIWAEKVKDRRGMNKATVALAHRMARISFAILRDECAYKNSPKRSLKQVA